MANIKIDDMLNPWKASIQRRITAEKNPLIKELLEQELKEGIEIITNLRNTLNAKK